MKATGWLFEMIFRRLQGSYFEMKGNVVSNFLEFPSFFTKFLYDTCLQKTVLFLSHFIAKRRYDDFSTAL